MAPPRGRKRKSEQSTVSTTDGDATRPATDQKIPTKAGTPARPCLTESPSKRRKLAVTLEQKQALIDNLQLEITQRARKLRAQYNLQAQGLRTRIEIRVNRIPMALRKAKMCDLVQKYGQQQQQNSTVPTAAAFTAPLSARPPPVPEKDPHLVRPASQRSAAPSAASRSGAGRAAEQLRHASVDKENTVGFPDGAKKRLRGHHVPEGGAPTPSQVLSPTSSNRRLPARERPPTSSSSPAKSGIARPASPAKQLSSSNLVSNLVEKARSTRAAAATRKGTMSSTASSGAGAGGRSRKGTTASATAGRAAAASRTAKRASGVSESSDGSTSTVVRKPVGRPPAASKAAASATAAAPATKRTVMGTIRKGVTGTATKKTAAKTAAPASTATGRVLRKRN